MTGGKVILPAIHIRPGTHAYNWGESASDTTLDLINSVSVRTLGVQRNTDLKISLLASEGPSHAPASLGAAVLTTTSAYAPGDFPAFPPQHQSQSGRRPYSRWRLFCDLHS
jgi:hypothetical protein